MRTILKFDTGADGFQKMIYVLAAAAAMLVVIGIYFLYVISRELQNIS